VPPFHASMPRPVSQAGPMHAIPFSCNPKFVDVALLPLTERVGCMLRYLPLEWTRWLRLWAGPIKRPERQGVYSPNWKETGEEGVLSDIVLVPVSLFICPVYSQCFSRRLTHGDRLPSHFAHLAPSAQAGLSGARGQGI